MNESATTDLPPKPEPPKLASSAAFRVEQALRATIEQLSNVQAAIKHAAASEVADEKIASLEKNVSAAEAYLRDAWNQPYSVVARKTANAQETIQIATKEIASLRRAHERREKRAERKARR